MPGAYALALLLSALGVALLDWRHKLAGFVMPIRTAVAVVIGTVFFLVWDLVGINAGIFVKGESSALLGIDLAPHLPIEEPLFLAFLCYLAIVCARAAARYVDRRQERGPDPDVHERLAEDPQ